MAVSTNTLTINGVNSGDYGLLLTSDTWENAPEIGYEAYQVPGRSGDLIRRENRMGNIVRRFELFAKGANARQNVEAFRKVIYSRPMGWSGKWQEPNYSRLQTSYDPGFYWYGYLVGEAEVEPFLSGDAMSLKMTLTFSCQPRKWSAGGEDTVNNWHSYRDDFGGIYKRGDPQIKALLKDTAYEHEHIADRFVAFKLHPVPIESLGMSGASWKSDSSNVTDTHFIAIVYEDTNGNFATYRSTDISLDGGLATNARYLSTAVMWYVLIQADMVFGTLTVRTYDQEGMIPLDFATKTYSRTDAVGYKPIINSWYNLNASNTNWQNSAIIVRGTSAGKIGTQERTITNFFGIYELRWDLLAAGYKRGLASNGVSKTIQIDDATFAGYCVYFNAGWAQNRPFMVTTQHNNVVDYFLDNILEEYGQTFGECEQIQVCILGATPGFTDPDGNIMRAQIVESSIKWAYWKV